MVLDISVVTFNSLRWLPDFFESLRAQAYPLKRIRLLIRDNGSSDGTQDWLRAHQDALQADFLDSVLEFGENLGFGQGHNRNLSHAQADWMLVTNPDLQFEHCTLVELVHAASSSDQGVASLECRQRPYEHPKHYHPATLEVSWSSSACVLLRVSALRQVGGYEPRLFLYGEDVDLSFRLRDAGFMLRYCPKASVWHHTYTHERQVKPAQFLGSTLANALIRVRFGGLRRALGAGLRLAALLAIPQQFPGQRLGLLRALLKFAWLAPQFWATRARSNVSFPLRGWDYEMTREGAFFESKPLPENLPLVSILVRTTPNRSGRLAEAVASVCNQTYPRIELVVVEDGGSTAEEFVRRIESQSPLERVVYRRLEKMGRCKAGNAALSAATGTFLNFLDDDDLLYADHVETLVQSFLQEASNNSTLGAVYGLGLETSTEVQSQEPWVYQELMHRVIHRQPFVRGVLWHHNFMPIQSVLFHRRLFERHGGFDPELDNLEDWNLWVRYSLYDDFALVPKLTSLYRVPARPEQSLERQRELDRYYALAQQKHAALRLELSPPQVLSLAEQLSRELFVVAIPKATLRAWVLQTPWLARLAQPLRRLWALYRRRVA